MATVIQNDRARSTNNDCFHLGDMPISAETLTAMLAAISHDPADYKTYEEYEAWDFIWHELLAQTPESREAIREAEDISRNPSAYKTYTSTEEMFAELDAEYQAELAAECIH